MPGADGQRAAVAPRVSNDRPPEVPPRYRHSRRTRGRRQHSLAHLHQDQYPIPLLHVQVHPFLFEYTKDHRTGCSCAPRPASVERRLRYRGAGRRARWSPLVYTVNVEPQLPRGALLNRLLAHVERSGSRIDAAPADLWRGR